MRLVSPTRLLPAFVAVALALPATAAAQSTGGASAPEPQPASDVALVASPQALLGREATLTGTVSRRARGRVLRVQRFDEAAKALALGGPDHGRPQGPLQRPLEPAGARPAADPRDAPAPPLRDASRAPRPRSPCGSSSPPWRPGTAPGCTATRRPAARSSRKELVGVAHKSLPCGTLVEVSYRGTSIVVPVVDRGPFVKGMTWDLTVGRGRAARLHRDGAHRRARPG